MLEGKNIDGQMVYVCEECGLGCRIKHKQRVRGSVQKDRSQQGRNYQEGQLFSGGTKIRMQFLNATIRLPGNEN